MRRLLELVHFREEGFWLAYAYRGGRQLAPAELPPGIEAATQKQAVREAKRRLHKAGWRFLCFLRVRVSLPLSGPAGHHGAE